MKIKSEDKSEIAEVKIPQIEKADSEESKQSLCLLSEHEMASPRFPSNSGVHNDDTSKRE